MLKGDVAGASKTFPQLRNQAQHLLIQALGNAIIIYQGGSSEVSATNRGFEYPITTAPAMTVYEREAAIGRNPIALGDYYLLAASGTPTVNVTVETE